MTLTIKLTNEIDASMIYFVGVDIPQIHYKGEACYYKENEGLLLYKIKKIIPSRTKIKELVIYITPIKQLGNGYKNKNGI